MSRKAFRKPPTMPYWFWLGQDGCWFCKSSVSQRDCTNCSVNKKYRKEFFGKKIKGRNSSNHKDKHKNRYDDYCF